MSEAVSPRKEDFLILVVMLHTRDWRLGQNVIVDDVTETRPWHRAVRGLSIN